MKYLIVILLALTACTNEDKCYTECEIIEEQLIYTDGRITTHLEISRSPVLVDCENTGQYYFDVVSDTVFFSAHKVVVIQTYKSCK